MDRPVLIGLTGGIAAGKTTAAEFLRRLGCGIVHADQIGKEVLEEDSEMLSWVRSTFGEEYFDSSGKLMRKELGNLVFSNPEKKKQLDDKIFSALYSRVKQRIEELSAKYAVIVVDAALIFEWGIESDFDLLVIVMSPVDDIYERLSRRDGFDNQAIDNRLKSQLPVSEKARRSHWVLNNDNSIKDLGLQVERFWDVKVQAMIG